MVKKIRKKPMLRAGSVILLGVVLLAGVLLLSGKEQRDETGEMIDATMEALRTQCVNYNEILTADCTKSLFRLSDYMEELSRDLGREPTLCNEAYIRQYIRDMHLSGVIVLNETLQPDLLCLSGITGFSMWAAFLNSEQLQDVMDYSAKIFAKRIVIGGVPYDVCAVSRRDQRGILFGYFCQPPSVLSERRENMSGIFTGFDMEQGGTFVIMQDGDLLAASSNSIAAETEEGAALLRELRQIPEDRQVHYFSTGTASYYGKVSACEGMTLYVFYPCKSVYRGSLNNVMLMAGVYITLCLVFSSAQNRAMAQNQQKLESANSSLQKTVNMLHSLESVYFAAFYVDLETDRFERLFCTPGMVDQTPPEGRYSDMKEELVRTLVLPSCREEMSRRLSLENIRTALREEKLSSVRHSFYVDYQADEGHAANWCRATVVLVNRMADGNPDHVMVVLQDVNEEKGREHSYQQRIVEEAQEARRANIAKTDFLRRISHDIRTPINAIQGLVKIADRYPEDLARQADYRQKVLYSSSILLDLMNSVLEMSKLESGEIILEHRPFDLRELLLESDSLAEVQALEHGVNYMLLPENEIPIRHLVGSPLHLQQILLNLTSNAVKYNREGGHVYVCTRMLSHTENAVVYQFVCRDDGLGISEEFQQHMYEPFTQEAENARTIYQGSGLGLSIVKRLVEVMHGTIEVESRKGVGTTFRVTLTFEIDRTSGAGEARPVLPESDGTELQGLRILLAEDNDLNMEVAEFLLRDHGAAVTRAWNGEETLALFQASEPGYYDLLLVDVMMPVMNGYEATRAIRALHRPDAMSVPIFAMTANAFMDDVRKSRDAGMNEHLTKPLDVTRLIELVGKYRNERPGT